MAKHDIELVEKVQRRFTKRLRGLRNLSYCDILTKLGLCTLELRRLLLDLLYCYKIVFGLVNVNFDDFLALTPTQPLTSVVHRPPVLPGVMHLFLITQS